MKSCQKGPTPGWRVLYLLPVLLLGCTEVTNAGLKLGVASAMLVVSGQDQTGTVGEELSTVLVVKVTDAADQPVAGQIVNFRATAGGGSVFAGAAITTAAGIAKERWTLGTSVADTQRLEARAIDPESGDPLVFATFRAVAVADVPVAIVKVSGDGQTVAAGSPAADSLVVRVEDRFANPVAGTAVTWTVASGSGQVSPSSVTVGANAIAKTRWTVGASTSVEQRVNAGVGSLPAGVFTAIPVAAAATQLLFAQQAVNAHSGAMFGVQPSVRIADTNGNTDLSATASVTMTVGSGASIVGTATATPVQGVATFADVGLSGPTSTYALTFTATLGGTPKTASQDISLLPGASTSYVVTAGAPTGTVGSAISISAQLVDGAGNTISAAGHVVTWARTGAGGSFASPTSTTNGSGVATTTFTLDGTFTADSVRVIALDDNSLSGFVRVSVTVGPPAKLTFRAEPAGVGYDVIMSAVTVAVTDSYGNTVTSDTRTVDVALSGPSTNLAGTLSKAAVAGVATFLDLRIDVPGSGYMLNATPASGGITAGTSQSFTVAPVGVVGASTGQSTNGGVFTGGVALADTSVYFSATGGLWRVSRIGGTVAKLADLGLTWPAGRMSVNSGSVDVLTSTGFISRDGYITRTPIDGGAGITYDLRDPVTNDFCYFSPELEFDGQYFIASCYHAGAMGSQPRIVRVRGSDGAQLILRIGTRQGHTLAISGGFVYFTDSTSGGATVQRLSIDGTLDETTIVTGLGTIGPYGSSQYSRRIAIGGGTIYWAEVGSGGSTTGSIRSAPLAGGMAQTRLSGLSSELSHLTTDGDMLYFSDGAIIKRMSLTDFSVSTVVEDVGGVLDIAVDNKSVYWLSTRFVKKAAK